MPIALFSVCVCMQAILLLTAVVGATMAYFCTIHKLTRRAILVVPFFVHRTSDSTAAERLETRRSATHAASQAFGFCVLILPFGGYLFWLAATTADRVSEVGRLTLPLLLLVDLLTCPLSLRGCNNFYVSEVGRLTLPSLFLADLPIFPFGGL